eukprot:404444_1
MLYKYRQIDRNYTSIDQTVKLIAVVEKELSDWDERRKFWQPALKANDAEEWIKSTGFTYNSEQHKAEHTQILQQMVIHALLYDNHDDLESQHDNDNNVASGESDASEHEPNLCAKEISRKQRNETKRM